MLCEYDIIKGLVKSRLSAGLSAKYTSAIDRAKSVASIFQTHYFIIGTTYQRDDRQLLHFRRAGRRALHAGSHVPFDVASVVALACRQ